MKKLLLSLTIIFSGFSTAYAQSAAEADSFKRWNVHTNPFSYFFGSVNAGVSYAFHKNITANLDPYYLYAYYVDPAVHGFGGKVSSSFFFDYAYNGFYLEPGVSYLYLTQDNSTTDDSASLFGPELIGGYSWLWDSGFTANVGLGLGYNWLSTDLADDGYLEGVVFAGELAFGYSF